MTNKWYDKEMAQLDKDLNEGLISQKEYDRCVRELDQDYEDAAQDAAQEAYDREYDQW